MLCVCVHIFNIIQQHLAAKTTTVVRVKIMGACFEAVWKLLTAFKQYIYAATAQVIQTFQTIFH